MKAIEKHITDAIGIIEKTFECHICVHGNRGEMASITYYHLNKVCTLLKKNSARQSLYCMDFDSIVIGNLIKKRKQPFMKVCTAGLCEVVVPIFQGEDVTGWVFCGPYFPDASIRDQCVFQEGTGTLKNDFNLPLLTQEKADDLIKLLTIITDLIGSEVMKNNIYGTQFKEQVENYIRYNYYLDIGTSDLAECLKCSTSRLSARINKEFGQHFRTLLNNFRFDMAVDLLRKSSFTISDIAHRCGFRDEKYFHRLFRKKYNMSPGEYKKQLAQ